MNIDEFESYALGKGYTFDKFNNDNDSQSQSYKKGKGDTTKYISVKKVLSENYVTYETSNSNEFLLIKNQMKKLGFIFVMEDSYNGFLHKIYTNYKYGMKLVTGDKGRFEISVY